MPKSSKAQPGSADVKAVESLRARDAFGLSAKWGKLTDTERAVVTAYFEGGHTFDPVAAYRSVCGEGVEGEFPGVEALDFFRRPSVAEVVSMMREASADLDQAWTKEAWLKELRRLGARAESASDWRSALRGLELIGKSKGYLDQTIKVEGRVEHTHELEAAEARLVRAVLASPSKLLLLPEAQREEAIRRVKSSPEYGGELDHLDGRGDPLVEPD